VVSLRLALGAAAVFIVLGSGINSAAAADPAPPTPAGRDARSLLFERDLLASQLELAQRGAPYLLLDAIKGEFKLLVSGVVLSRFPSERRLVGGRFRRALARRDPGSPLLQPFRWVGLDTGEEARGPGSLTLRLDPPLRIDFEASPSDFFWRSLRFNLGDRLGIGGKGDSALNLVLFYQPDSLAAFAPLLADSLDVLVLPSNN